MFRRRLCYLLISYLFCQVDCEPTGATEESCGDIFPMHYSDNNETMFQNSFVCDLDNLASLGFTKCFELIVEGFENMSDFTYNCGQSYNGKNLINVFILYFMLCTTLYVSKHIICIHCCNSMQ